MTTGRTTAGVGAGATAGSPASIGHTALPGSTVSGISDISRASTALAGFTGSVPGQDIWGASAGDRPPNVALSLRPEERLLPIVFQFALLDNAVGPSLAPPRAGRSG